MYLEKQWIAFITSSESPIMDMFPSVGLGLKASSRAAAALCILPLINFTRWWWFACCVSVSYFIHDYRRARNKVEAVGASLGQLPGQHARLKELFRLNGEPPWYKACVNLSDFASATTPRLLDNDLLIFTHSPLILSVVRFVPVRRWFEYRCRRGYDQLMQLAYSPILP